MDRESAHEQCRPDGARGAHERPDQRPAVARPADGVEEEERNRPKREVQIRERNRRDRRSRPQQPPAAAAARALERPQRQRQEHRDHSSQVAGALGHAVRRKLEDEPAYQCRAARQPELAEPEERESACREIGQQQQHVPGDDRPERGLERPERRSERPAAEVHARAALRPERVRVEPRRPAVLHLVPDQPEVVDGLQVIADRGLAVDRLGPRREVRPEVLGRRPHRREADGDVERAGESYKARAAESSSSKSGTSAVS